MKQTLMAITLAATVGAAACTKPAQTTETSAPRSAHASVERGRYLVSVMGCNDCHTPMKMGPQGPEPDMTRMLSGHPEQVGALSAPSMNGGPWMWTSTATNTAFAGPWGISYTANLTPDQNTGLGIWTEDMFVQAIKTGKHMGTSRPILPPMPWPAFRTATDEDLRSIYQYLRTIKPIANHVPDPTAPQQAMAGN